MTRSKQETTFGIALAIVGGLAPAGSFANAETFVEENPYPTPAAVVRHVPVSQLRTGTGSLDFDVQHPDQLGDIVVHVRPLHGNADATVEVVAVRTSRGFQAELPGAVVEPPGITYWVTERSPDGSQRPVFADAADPHPVVVVDSPEAARLREELFLRRGNRSSMTLSGEYVDFGDRSLEGYDGQVPDRYAFLEGSYSYSILSTVEEIRIGVGLVRGEAANPVDIDPDTGVGIDYGEALITWRASPLFRLRTGVLFGFSQRGFEAGGTGEGIIGHPYATSFTFGVEGVTTLGWTGRVRLGWATVTKVPMGATVEVTTFPVGEDPGVRLLYDVGYQLTDHVAFRFEGGYQARTSVTGGPSAALELAFGF